MEADAEMDDDLAKELGPQFAGALVGAAIGGIVATLVTGDALALVVALIAGPCVYHLANVVLDLDARILVGGMAATGVALSYIVFGVWVAVVVVVLWVALLVYAFYSLMHHGELG